MTMCMPQTCAQPLVAGDYNLGRALPVFFLLLSARFPPFGECGLHRPVPSLYSVSLIHPVPEPSKPSNVSAPAWDTRLTMGKEVFPHIGILASQEEGSSTDTLSQYNKNNVSDTGTGDSSVVKNTGCSSMNPGSIPSIHVWRLRTAYNSSSRGSRIPFQPLWAPAHVTFTYGHKPHV